MERLDKLFSSCKILSRTECKKQVKLKNILVNGKAVKDSSLKISEKDVVTFNGEVVKFNKFRYVMLNKPQGVVSSTEEKNQKTVLDVLPTTINKAGLFPCGRLDKDTVGLVILTDDGVSAHKRLAPKNKTKKEYYFECAEVVLGDDILKITSGVTLKDGYTTKPCSLVMQTEKSGIITLIEGKYHEIKRIFGSVGNKITYLKRISFGGICLDKTLKEGESRELTLEEIELFVK